MRGDQRVDLQKPTTLWSGTRGYLEGEGGLQGLRDGSTGVCESRNAGGTAGGRRDEGEGGLQESCGKRGNLEEEDGPRGLGHTATGDAAGGRRDEEEEGLQEYCGK
jgi:hypothetical protein